MTFQTNVCLISTFVSFACQFLIEVHNAKRMNYVILLLATADQCFDMKA